CTGLREHVHRDGRTTVSSMKLSRSFGFTLALATTFGGILSNTARADTDFPAGSLVIPMDSCFQMGATPGYDSWQSGSCSAASASCPYNGGSYPTGSIKLGFGVLYLLSTFNIPVYIAESSTKLTLGDADFSISQPNSSTQPATVLTWNSAVT